jgi:hypothetical protein
MKNPREELPREGGGATNSERLRTAALRPSCYAKYFYPKRRLLARQRVV